jgi:hypothetical protein
MGDVKIVGHEILRLIEGHGLVTGDETHGVTGVSKGLGDESISADLDLSSNGIRFGKESIQVEVTDADGKVVSGEIQRDDRRLVSSEDTGIVTARVVSQAPQNEEGSEEIARRLIAEMNRNGFVWSEPYRGEEPADWEASRQDDATSRLRIQVGRLNSQSFWDALGRCGESNRVTSLGEVTQELMDFVAKKSRRYGPTEKATLVLAVDASLNPAVYLGRFVESLQSRKAQDELRAAGFHQIWLLGPNLMPNRQNVWQLHPWNTSEGSDDETD